jgi:hypothetical protein
MTSGAIVERIDVVGHVRDGKLAVLVDLFLDSLFLQAAEERLRYGVGARDTRQAAEGPLV